MLLQVRSDVRDFLQLLSRMGVKAPRRRFVWWLNGIPDADELFGGIFTQMEPRYFRSGISCCELVGKCLCVCLSSLLGSLDVDAVLFQQSLPPPLFPARAIDS